MNSSPHNLSPSCSVVYSARILHERTQPASHRFAYSIFYFAVYLDELPALSRRLSLFSLSRWNLFSLRESDHLPLSLPVHNPSSGAALPQLPVSSTLSERVRALCSHSRIDLGASPRILLVTLPRMLGHRFNPVSFFFCYDQSGHPLAAIAEVTNTFGEVKPYVIPLDRSQGSRFRLRCPKHFYVSPFSAPELDFDFDLGSPNEQLSIRIDTLEGERCVLHSALTGKKAALTDRSLVFLALSHPLVGLVVLFRIHLQAFRLWRRKFPFFAKSDRPAAQRDLYHPHHSLTPESSS